MTRAYIDAAVLVHALGSQDDLRQACQGILDMVESGELVGEAAVLVIDEFTHVRFRRRGNRAEAAEEAGAASAILVLHEVTPADLDRALDLFAGHASLDMRDALHAAVAQRAGLEVIVTTDSDFDRLAGLRRIDPRDPDAVTELAG